MDEDIRRLMAEHKINEDTAEKAQELIDEGLDEDEAVENANVLFRFLSLVYFYPSLFQYIDYKIRDDITAKLAYIFWIVCFMASFKIN